MHSSYFDHDSESLCNISQIVNGHNGDADIEHADHVYDPWYDGPRDPEKDPDVSQPSTSRRVP